MSAGTERSRRGAVGRRVRIGLDVGKALGAVDGIGRYTRGLVTGLRELESTLPESERFEYRLFPLFRCATELGATDLVGDAEGFRLADHPVPRPGEVDLFHATAWAVPATHRGPLALTLYDLTFLTLAETHTELNRAHCLIGLARALARGGALCAISRSVREEASSRLGIGAERIAIASPGIDRGFVPASADAVAVMRARLGLEGPFVLALGTFEPRKNLRGLLEAWARVPESRRRGLRLVLAGGEGWAGTSASEPLPQLARRLGIAAGVDQLGRVPDELLPALYSAAELFVYPSLAEGFGLPPLEAMACGTAVVASDRPALPEVLGETAVLVDAASPDALASAIAALLGDAERRAALGEAGPRRAERYTWRSTAHAVRELWERTLTCSGGESV